MARFSRIAPEVLEETDPHQLFQDVADHYRGSVGSYLGDVEDLDVPSEVRVVGRLWFFLAEIGGGGIRDYLWNHCFSLRTLKQIHADLAEVGAHDLRRMLEAGIKITADRNCGEFLKDPGAREWAGMFENGVESESEHLDRLSSAAAYPMGSAIVACYIKRNAAVF